MVVRVVCTCVAIRSRPLGGREVLLQACEQEETTKLGTVGHAAINSANGGERNRGSSYSIAEYGHVLTDLSLCPLALTSYACLLNVASDLDVLSNSSWMKLLEGVFPY
jgi:hypothetical protein